MEWYSLRVISGKEKKVKEFILREAGDANISEMISEIFVPAEKVVEMRANKKRTREKVFFPGYVLIRMDLTAESRYIVENTQGVMSFVGPKDGPVPLREDEIKRIFGEVQSKDGQEVFDIPFKVGDAVRVVDGPFLDFTGVVDELNLERKKIKVIVSIFGRPTPVELDIYQIEMDR